MTGLAQRQRIVEDIGQARIEGVSLERACTVRGISVNCWYRWQRNCQIQSDGRPLAVRPPAANRITDEEHQAILDICNSPPFASVPPSQIVSISAQYLPVFMIVGKLETPVQGLYIRM